MYSLPAGSTVTNGDTSDASDLNTPLADIEADLNVARPIVAGGTGATSAAAALVNLGLTATAAEINVLDGVTASTAELNILDGVTASTAELNVLDGIPGTLTATELGYVDGVTSAIQSQLNAKGPLPQSSSGVGQWLNVFAGDNVALVLPAGGTWAWNSLAFSASGGTFVSGGGTGVSAGGTTVMAAQVGRVGTALCWRIS